MASSEVAFERHEESSGEVPPSLMEKVRLNILASAAAIVGLAPRWKVGLGAAAVLLAALSIGKSVSSRRYYGGGTRNGMIVGAYYYPWYGNDFHGGEGYMRRLLQPPQYPTLGEYNDQDSSVISQHLSWSRQANIGLWVVSWWGAGTETDVTSLQYILYHEKLFDMQIAIHYETLGLTNEFSEFDGVAGDIEYLAGTYFDHPNYLRIGGRPVIFVYEAGSLYLLGLLDYVVGLMRDAAAGAGHDIYVVGDGAYGRPGESPPVDGVDMVDAITCYDTYGSMGATGYAGQDAVDDFYDAQAEWRSLAHSRGVHFIPAATPGFNDKGVRDGHTALSRKLTSYSEFGTLFRAMLKRAVKLVDRSADRILMIVSFNEWHEDTQIEPVAESDVTWEDCAGQSYTDGLEYEGYGEKYLEILRKATSSWWL